MKKLFIKATCMLLTLIVLLSFISVAVFAADVNTDTSATTSLSDEGEGTSEELSPFEQKLEDFRERLYLNFIKEKRYKYLVDGLKTTLIITVFAVLVGICIGVVVASIRYSYDQLEPNRKRTLGGIIFWIFNFLCKIYLTVIRGTPVMIQLLIIYYFIITGDVSKVVVAIIAFGINSGAYVAEIVRSGLSSIDRGQFEAGRSLGLNYLSTMKNIIIPQAFKNILPALGNELIVLLKETSISGYIALYDLTAGGDIIRSLTYDAIPLFTVALIYLSVVMVLTFLVSKLENKLKQSDSRAVRKPKNKKIKSEVRE